MLQCPQAARLRVFSCYSPLEMTAIARLYYRSVAFPASTRYNISILYLCLEENGYE